MDPHLDIGQPRPSDSPPDPTSDPTFHIHRLTDPGVISAVSEVAQARSVLKALGPRPDHETVDKAKSKIAEIEADLSRRLEEIVRSPRPPEIERLEWRAHLAGKEKEVREAAERERQVYQAVVSVDEMHGAYERLVRDAEDKLERIYEAGAKVGEGQVADKGDDEVVGILREAVGKGIDQVNLSGRRLRLIPEAFGRIRGLVVLNLSSNQLESLPDSIGGLENLQELHLASNLLESLPDTIGLLLNLRILDVSGNQLVALPDSICNCRSLVELDTSFNKLTYLPTNIGYELVNLKRLSVQLNKIHSLPSSIGEMRSLHILDVHFNELCGLPLSIGRLTNLEILNLSSNFSDLTELPDTIGDLTNLKELDLSNNQIHTLPSTFGRLDNLTKLNLEENPIVIPPKEIVNEGVEAVKIYMAKRWVDILVEEERRSMLQVQGQAQVNLLTRSTSWLKTIVSGVSGTVSGYLGTLGKSPIDPYLDQQL